MKKKIIKILLKHSSELKIKSGIMNEPDEEQWLWSGDFDIVADEIVKLYGENNVKCTFCKTELTNCPVCGEVLNN